MTALPSMTVDDVLALYGRPDVHLASESEVVRKLRMAHASPLPMCQHAGAGDVVTSMPTTIGGSVVRQCIACGLFL